MSLLYTPSVDDSKAQAAQGAGADEEQGALAMLALAHSQAPHPLRSLHHVLNSRGVSFLCDQGRATFRGTSHFLGVVATAGPSLAEPHGPPRAQECLRKAELQLESSGGGGDAKSASLLATLSLSATALAGVPALQPAGALRGARACLALLADPAAPRGAARAAALELALCSTLSAGRRALARIPGAARALLPLCAKARPLAAPAESALRARAAGLGRFCKAVCNLRACLTCVGTCTRVLHALESARRGARSRRARAGRRWRSRAFSWRRRCARRRWPRAAGRRARRGRPRWWASW